MDNRRIWPATPTPKKQKQKKGLPDFRKLSPPNMILKKIEILCSTSRIPLQALLTAVCYMSKFFCILNSGYVIRKKIKIKNKVEQAVISGM